MGSEQSIACSIRLNSSLTDEQKARFQNDETIRRILARRGTIAVVGLSADPQKASHFVASYFLERGWRIVPVTPRAGTILGVPTVPDLLSIKEPVDVVDIIRPPEEIPGIVEQAIKIGAKAVWMQLRLIDIPAAEKALEAGLDVVVDRCIKMEHGRYGGGLHSAGMNTEIISARRRSFK